jgi:hypothetical protein
LQSVVAKELPVFDWSGAAKRRALLPIFALIFAALLSTVPSNAQQFTSKFISLGSLREQLNISPGLAIGADSVRAAAMGNNRIQVFHQDRDFVYRSRVAETSDYQSNLHSLVWAWAAYINNGYYQLPAISCLQVVDQISSYRFTLY